MSNIFINLYTHGSGGDFLQQMLYKERDTLEKNNVIMPELSYEMYHNVHSNYPFFSTLIYYHENNNLAEIRQNIAAIENEVLNGKDIVISFHPKTFLHELSSFKDFLAHNDILQHATIAIFFSFSHYDYWLEKISRNYIDLDNSKLVESINNYDNLYSGLSHLKKIMPVENFDASFYPFSADKPFNKSYFHQLRKRFLDFCHLPQNIGENFTPREPGRRSSVLIWSLLRQCRNNFAKPDIEKLYYSLCDVEEKLKLPLQLFSPLEDRKKLFEKFQADWKGSDSIYNIQEAQFSGLPASDAAIPVQEIRTIIANLPTEEKNSLQKYISGEYYLLPEFWQTIADNIVTVGNVEVINTPAPVSVLTLAYNQEKYIERCIKSVAAQKADFPIQHIILDDESTDSTPKIIYKYASNPAIKPVFLPKPHLRGGENVLRLFQECHSPYACLCDGDDYFTDPLKIQKQVKFLESFPECALCFHPVEVIYEDGSPARVYPPEENLPCGVRKFYTIKDLFQGNMIQTNSVMYRWRFKDGVPDWFDPSLTPGDWYWHLLHAETGLIGYQREVMSVYWRHAASLYATADIGHVTHRNLHGLNELKTYQAVNNHFKGRYYTHLMHLANGVLADFLRIYIETGDDELLQKGCAICPDFARDFLKQVKIISKKKD